MQTFLPYADFSASAAVLDQSRLGKQRVEALQVLRALVIPDYGWRSHPAVRMWMGHVPALVQYGLAMADEWTGRGNTDATRHKILEFAPLVEGHGTLAHPTTANDDGAAVVLPPWLGDPAFHRAHQSNLIRKDAAFYAPRFKDVADDLPYLWPEPVTVELPEDLHMDRLWIFRGEPKPRNGSAEDAATSDTERILLRRGSAPRKSPKWQRQLHAFAEELAVGSAIAVTADGGQTFRLGTVASPSVSAGNGDLARDVVLEGERSRASFPYPALLQDPRTLFAVALRG